MTTYEFAKEAMESLLYVEFKESDWVFDKNIANLQTDESKAVIRFKSGNDNYCVVATSGFCNLSRPSFLVLTVTLAIKNNTMPKCLPNNAEIPFWLTESDAYIEPDSNEFGNAVNT